MNTHEIEAKSEEPWESQRYTLGLVPSRTRAILTGKAIGLALGLLVGILVLQLAQYRKIQEDLSEIKASQQAGPSTQVGPSTSTSSSTGNEMSGESVPLRDEAGNVIAEVVVLPDGKA